MRPSHSRVHRSRIGILGYLRYEIVSGISFVAKPEPMRKLTALLLSCMAATCCAAPVRLRTNALDNPLGIDTERPVFSWRSDAARANWMQSAYEILVSTDPA